MELQERLDKVAVDLALVWRVMLNAKIHAIEHGLRTEVHQAYLDIIGELKGVLESLRIAIQLKQKGETIRSLLVLKKDCRKPMRHVAEAFGEIEVKKEWQLKGWYPLLENTIKEIESLISELSEM